MGAQLAGPADRGRHRLTLIRPISSSTPPNAEPRPVQEYLKLDRLGRGGSLHGPPEVLVCAAVPDLVTLGSWEGPTPIATARHWVLHDPAADAAAVHCLTVDVDAGVDDLPLIADDLHHWRLRVAGIPLPQWIELRLTEVGMRDLDFGPPHQLVFVCDPERTIVDDRDAVLYILMRASLPIREGYQGYVAPEELNRRPYMLCLSTEYVSVAIGQQDYVENAMWLVVCELLMLREGLVANENALRRVLALLKMATGSSIEPRRRGLSAAIDQLVVAGLQASDQQLRLNAITYRFESLRLREYVVEIADVLGITTRIDATAQLARHLEGVARQESSALALEAAAESEQRQRRNSIIVASLSLLLGPPTLALGFLGANVSEIDETLSILDRRYVAVYGAIVLLFLIAMGVVYVATWLGARNRRRRLQELRTEEMST
jgi:hypothetical protein